MRLGGSRISIRTAREEDRTALLALAPRLAIGITPWRDVAGMEDAARGWIAALDGIGPDQAVFVAAGADGVIHGFAGVARQVAFTGEPQAYLGELAVAETSEGAGVGRSLVEAVEAWARVRGLGLIVLDTGAGNTRARQFYARNGFVDEGVKLTKVLCQDNSMTRSSGSAFGQSPEILCYDIPPWGIVNDICSRHESASEDETGR